MSLPFLKEKKSFTDLYSYLKLFFFKNFSIRFFWLTVYLFIIFLIITIYLCLVVEFESDFQQSSNYRFLFIHIAAAWYSLLLYFLVSIISVLYLIFKYPLIYFIARIINFIGISFSTITIVSGIFWSLPTWGADFMFDSRLVSFGFLWLAYLSYWILGTSFLDDTVDSLHGSIAASLIAIIGLFNLPLMKFSVDWWNTIHQVESFTYESTSIYIVNLIRILLLIILFFFYILFLFFIRFRIILLNRKIYSILNKL